MRIKQLSFIAYGPFTDKTLEFTLQTPGLHIIFGNNEAGKSSSLRALKALLFGFPRQTPDNFLHNYDQLMVGGTIIDDDGRELNFQRRKRIKGDLLDKQGQPTAINILKPFIQTVEPELFDTLYGISHDSLVQGGEEILAQKGEIGKTLFAAGAGISSIKKIIDQLNTEAAELYKARGQIQAVNASLKRFKELKQRNKSIILSVKEWKQHTTLLEESRAKRLELEQMRESKNRELVHLEQLHRAIPEIGLLHSLQKQIAALGKIPPIDADFPKRQQNVQQKLNDDYRELQSRVIRRNHLQERLETIAISTTILNQSETVDALVQKLGEYRKGQQDKPMREGQRVSLRREAAALLELVRPDLNLETIDSLRPLLSRKRTIQELAREYERIHQTLRHQKQVFSSATIELETLERKTADLKIQNVDNSLQTSLTLARQAGDLDASQEKLNHAISLSTRECKDHLHRIGLWQNGIEQLMKTALPLLSTVKQFEEKLRTTGKELEQLTKQERQLREEENEVIFELNKIEHESKIPTENELFSSRKIREQGWLLLRRVWINQEDITDELSDYAGSKPLPDIYEQHVQKADHIADRLRRETDKVSQAAILQSKLTATRQNLQKTKKDIEQSMTKQADLLQKWNSLWYPISITPLSPTEMAEWLGEIDKLAIRWKDILKQQHELKSVQTKKEQLRSALLKGLKKQTPLQHITDETLMPIVAEGEKLLAGIQKQQQIAQTLLQQQEKMQITHSKAAADINKAEKELADWQQRWRNALKEMQPAPTSPPTEALDKLETLQLCFEKLREANDLQKRINGIDRDAAKLTQKVGSLLNDLIPGETIPSVEQATLRLRDITEKAKKDDHKQNELNEEINQLNAEIETLENLFNDSNRQMKQLLQEAECAKPEELPAIIETFNTYLHLKEKIINAELVLTKIGAGTSTEQLEQQAQQTDINALPGKINKLKQEIDQDINPEINEVSQEIGQQKIKIAAMDGSAEAAKNAEDMEQELAGLKRQVRKYTQLKAAAAILQSAIEAYRKKHQDPVLEIGSTYFNKLTQNSFAGLRADIDDNGEPLLVGLRPDNRLLKVEAMSSGTRDQLYLALRLATIQWRLETQEAFPFIVDDILINFDDARSQATLQCLGELAKKNQVILFTHHQQIVTTAKKIIGDLPIQIHNL